MKTLSCECEITTEAPGSDLSGMGNEFRDPKYEIESNSHDFTVINVYTSIASGIRYKVHSAKIINNQLNLICSTESSDTIEFELVSWKLKYKIKLPECINLETVLFNNKAASLLIK